MKNVTLKKLNTAWLGRTISCLFILFFTLVFVVNPSRYIACTLEGITLWAICVLPASFPFFFSTALLTRLGAVNAMSKTCAPFFKKIFNQSGISSYVLFMSFLCGYPVGAKVLSDIYEMKLVPSSETKKISLFCSSSGPLFILGTVGVNFFHNPTCGLILLLTHYLSILITALIFRFLPYKEELSLPPIQNSDNLLAECINSSVLTVLAVGGSIAIFYMLSQMVGDFIFIKSFCNLLNNIPFFNGQSQGFICGLIEMTGGCRALSGSITASSLALCSFLIAFGGISILFQQICFLKKAKVPLPFFIGIKILQAFISSILCYFFALWIL